MLLWLTLGCPGFHKIHLKRTPSLLCSCFFLICSFTFQIHSHTIKHVQYNISEPYFWHSVKEHLAQGKFNLKVICYLANTSGSKNFEMPLFTSIKGDCWICNMNRSNHLCKVQSIVSSIFDCYVIHHRHMWAGTDGCLLVEDVGLWRTAMVRVQTWVADVQILQKRERLVHVNLCVALDLFQTVEKPCMHILIYIWTKLIQIYCMIYCLAHFSVPQLVYTTELILWRNTYMQFLIQNEEEKIYINLTFFIFIFSHWNHKWTANYFCLHRGESNLLMAEISAHL